MKIQRGCKDQGGGGMVGWYLPTSLPSQILSNMKPFQANVIMPLCFPRLNTFLLLSYPQGPIGSPIIEIPVILVCLPICKLNRSLTYLRLCQFADILLRCKPGYEPTVDLTTEIRSRATLLSNPSSESGCLVIVLDSGEEFYFAPSVHPDNSLCVCGGVTSSSTSWK